MDIPDSHKPSPFFVLRTALLPWEVYQAWGEGLRSPEADPEGLDEALASDRTTLRRRLQAEIQRPEHREALFLASPDLDVAIPHWFSEPEGEKGQRAERALVRYFSRMCGRSTPFGLFAGCSMGRVGDATRLAVAGRGEYIRHTRLDMDYLCALTEALAREPELQAQLNFRPNTSLYHTAGRLRLAESRLANKSRAYHLVAVDETDYLAATLERAKPGATLRQLAEALVDAEITLDDAQAYIQELVASQLLVPELEPPVTGPEPIHNLIPLLEALPAGATASRALDEARRAMDQLDSEPLGLPPDRYRAIAKGLETLPAKVELNRLFQVDMVKPAPDALLGGPVIEVLREGVALLHRLSPTPAKTAMSQFAEAFTARYEIREMPLAEVLDEETGIGFNASNSPGSEASPLLEGMHFPGAPGDNLQPWSAREAFLLRKLLERDPNGKDGDLVLRLEAEELEPFAVKKPLPLPDSFAVMADLAAASPEALAAGDFKLCFLSATGPSGAILMGRFCHGDPALTEAVAAHLRDEEAHRPDAVFAEIVHLPEGRIGNVILRPQLRGYEIPFLGRSGAPGELQIPISDLMVSVRGGRVVLRSKLLGKEVLPRLTNAHNYSARSLGLYRFLCMLQHQGVTGGLSWSWGLLTSAPFLPRVEIGRLVVSKAIWRVEQKNFKPISDAEAGDRWRKLQAWRAESRLPKLALLVDGDNKLPVDFDNVLSVDMFIDAVKKRSGFQLEEMYPGPGDLPAEGPEGHFVHEIVVPFSRMPVDQQPTSPARQPAEPLRLRRTFAPGSEWLYAKLYAGVSGVDQLLREVVLPLVTESSAITDRWFFIRYGDPDWHLRLRLHGDPRRLTEEVLPRLHALAEPLREQGVLWKLQIDTYERELERYGDGEAMELAEQFFHADSDATLRILQHFSGDAAADARWRLALRGMDQLLEDMGFSLEAKYDLLTSVRGSFLQEFRGEGALEHQMGDRFRKERKTIGQLLDPAGDEASPLREAMSILRERSARLIPVMTRLRTQIEGRSPGSGMESIESLAGSFLHMHANRLLRASARAQELVLYDFLARHYESRLARQRKSREVAV